KAGRVGEPARDAFMSRKVEYSVVKVAYVLFLVTLVLYLVSPFIIPIVFAGTVALTLYPLQKKLELKGWSKKKASALLTSAFLIIISLPFSVFLAKGTTAVTYQLEKFQTDERYKDKGFQKIFSTIKRDFVSK